MKPLSERMQELTGVCPRKLWVIGKSGQVAQALAAEIARTGWEAEFTDRHELDLEFPDKIPRALDDRLARHFRPDAIINAAAYTQVDQAEKEPDLALRINSRSVGEIARWCADLGIPFIHVSTDYVFSGTGTKPWTETDPVDPLNTYGRTKLVGEMEAAKSGATYQIFRTSWVYDHQGKNFFNTMLKLGADREEIKVVADQIGAPTYAPHLAQALLCGAAELARSGGPTGIFHFANRGEISWHEFASEIFRAMAGAAPLKVKRVLPIPTRDYPTPAPRPENSRFNLDKTQSAFAYQIPEWREGLRECVARKLGG